MATSFNGTTFKWSANADPAVTPDKEIALDSLTFAGGDVAAVDFTAANSSRRLQKTGFRNPYQITVSGKAPTTSSGLQPSAGDFIDWTISNTTMDQAGFNWYVESIEISGSVDEANAITMTIIEGNGAT
jgi:hypothetical protein